jgi:hypothetical protein
MIADSVGVGRISLIWRKIKLVIPCSVLEILLSVVLSGLHVSVVNE